MTFDVCSNSDGAPNTNKVCPFATQRNINHFNMLTWSYVSMAGTAI